MEVTNINGHIRFCAWESYNGARRHYLCSHREYCCALGCCVSTAFSLYQLWYFWLLLLLIILLCSGGGWWFRFRHGGFSTQSTPTNNRGRRHGRRGRGQDAGAPRVYPNQHQFYGPGLHHGAYTLPPGYDKDPPSYNEVISHLNQFPRIEDVRRVERERTTTSTSTDSIEQVPLDDLYDCQSTLPPPPYEMVLDLKRREMQLTREINELEEEEESRVRTRSAGEEMEDAVNSTRSRIKNLLGRIRPRSSSSSDSSQARQEGSGRSASSSSSSPSSSSSGLFTISRESLPQHNYYTQEAVPSSSEAVQHQGSLMRRYPAGPPSEPDSSSHSDYSSVLVSSLSSSSRSLFTSPSQAPMELVPTSPLEGEIITPEPQEPGHVREQSGHERPSTCHSVLSRPTTSISTRTLPPPEELIRKTSLPGALLEQDDDRIEMR
ncbi:uncharacterized protein LOC135116139 [Scylla paramamosain]